MSSQLLVLPLIAQIFLTLALYVTLNVQKSRAVKAGEVDEARRALHEDAWPDYVQQINNSIRSQFEVPVLFYVIVLAFLVLNSVDLLTLALCWAFIASRVVHALVHTRSNYVPTRRKAFVAGIVCIMVLAVKLLLVAHGIG